MNECYMGAEWEKHSSTWLSWPINTETWPGELLLKCRREYAAFVATVSRSELVHLLIPLLAVREAKELISEVNGNFDNIEWIEYRTDDAWIRDYGPDFILHKGEKKVLSWEYNAWGGKYPPFDKDNAVPEFIGEYSSLQVLSQKIVLEGGSIELNGNGDLLTTASCLLHSSRNPEKSKVEIEGVLKATFGVKRIIWLDGEIEGDDTDGHIDNIARFVNESTILLSYTSDQNRMEYSSLHRNVELLKNERLCSGHAAQVDFLPLPSTILINGVKIPASYANFYITNKHVIVPVFEDKQDDVALNTIGKYFPDREVVGLSSRYITYGLGSFHCLSKHELAY